MKVYELAKVVRVKSILIELDSIQDLQPNQCDASFQSGLIWINLSSSLSK